jgi:DNA-binding beta-propeller fold protein YncE
MRVAASRLSYAWIGDWARLADDESVRRGWAHSDLAVLGDGRIATGHPGEPRLLLLDADGQLLSTAELDVAEIHGVTVHGDALWIADVGRKRRPHDGYANPSGLVRGQVVQVDPRGRVLARLEPPPLPVYETTSYSPTGTAVDPNGGDVWVADGYGASLVHRYDRHGRWIQAVSGEEGAGRFNCPHAVLVDTRRGEGELYVADRANGRIQVYGLDGTFRRLVGAEELHSPTNLAVDGERLVVAEFRAARLTVLDADDRLLDYLGVNAEVVGVEGWPNELDERGVPRRTSRLRPGMFNSPHGVAADAGGNLYVTEWLIGGRYAKLVPASP